MLYRRSFLMSAAATAMYAASLCAGTAHAQTPAPPLAGVPLTLDQVLDLGEARSEAIAIARASIRRAEGDQVRARSGLFPQLSFTGSYDRALASEYANLFNNFFNNGSGGSGSSGTTNGGESLPFGQRNTWRATLTFSQNIYSGNRNGLQKQVAALGHDTATHGLTTARAQALLDITQAYYDAVLGERLVSIAQATLDQASATLRQAEAAFNAGSQPEFEVVRARVTRDNQSPIVIRQRVNRAVALLRLKQLLDLPGDYDLQLADALSEDRLPPPSVYATRVAAVEAALESSSSLASTIQSELALPSRVVTTDAETALQLRETSLELAEAQRKPSASLNSTFYRVGYPSGVVPLLDRTNWTIGASVQVPLLTGGRQKGDELVARADVEQSRAQLRQTQELAALDTRSAWAELAAARAAWEATSGTVQQATRAFQIADVRYQSGVSTQLELSDSRLQLQQAEANRAQAARDLQVARARVALLPELPLGAASTGAPVRVPQQQLPQTNTPTPVQQTPGTGQLVNAGGAQGFTTGTR
jgi:outer membrane protein TolC